MKSLASRKRSVLLLYGIFLVLGGWSLFADNRPVASVRGPARVLDARSDRPKSAEGLPFPHASGMPLRFRAQTKAGILVVFDVVAPNPESGMPGSYVVAWRPLPGRDFLIFDRPVETPFEIAQALLALEREQGVEAESVGGGQQWLARALEYARVHAEKTTAESDAITWHWKARTRGELLGMMPGGVAARGQSKTRIETIGWCGRPGCLEVEDRLRRRTMGVKMNATSSPPVWACRWPRRPTPSRMN